MNSKEVNLLIYSIGLIVRNMDKLKGSLYYSTRVLKELEVYEETKLKGLFKDEASVQSSDGVNILETLFNVVYTVTSEEKSVEFIEKLIKLSEEYGVKIDTIIRRE